MTTELGAGGDDAPAWTRELPEMRPEWRRDHVEEAETSAPVADLSALTISELAALAQQVVAELAARAEPAIDLTGPDA